MKIKRMIQRAVEILTNRKCENCKHFDGLFCKSPKGRECGKSIFPIGWEKKGGASDACKVGTEVYLSDYIDKHHRIKEYKFIGNKIAVVIECWEFQGTCTRWLDDFGKTIFLTREEAERALKGGE